jgi:hypothetical protein
MISRRRNNKAGSEKERKTIHEEGGKDWCRDKKRQDKNLGADNFLTDGLSPEDFELTIFFTVLI